ncbi:helix-turn-helix domain-containing protein [Lactococcus lactis]|uniref:helix-turn-helix domain-containing protein n=1 Tax=Lactococcus lactis TaxID=1358 RepID=UPI0018AA2C66|nr:helix-turn-helix transcriptional regulator [Lactococcus lactis]
MDEVDNDSEILTYSDEKIFFDNIRNGICIEKEERDSDSLYVLNNIGRMATSPKKQIEYYIASSIVLGCRAAIDGKVPPPYAYKLSDLFFHELESCLNIEQMLSLSSSIQNGYALLVKEVKDNRSNYSDIEKAKLFIKSNLLVKFNLNDVAKSVFLNKSYLSRIFKKETGLTVMEYARKKKIDLAKSSLKYSNKSLSDIALELNYASQSYFGKIFKEETGLTPKIYREKEKLIE